jgi:DNA-binding transcriptional ArsR family regulator
MKYWNERRIKRVRERRNRKEAADNVRYFEALKRDKMYTKGAKEKNAALMLDALGSAERRTMIKTLRSGGAMSLTKLAYPERLRLTTALSHMRILEQSGLITTHKRGRVRMCVLNPVAFKELSQWISSQ